MSDDEVGQSMSVVPSASAAQMRMRCASDLEATAAREPESLLGVMIALMPAAYAPQPRSMR